MALPSGSPVNALVNCEPIELATSCPCNSSNRPTTRQMTPISFCINSFKLNFRAGFSPPGHTEALTRPEEIVNIKLPARLRESGGNWNVPAYKNPLPGPGRTKRDTSGYGCQRARQNC